MASWANKLFDGSTSETKATKRRIRTIRLEWHSKVQEANKKFIIDTARDLASKYNCDTVNIRADIHSTKTVLTREAAEPVMVPRNNRHGATLTPGPNNRMRVVKSIEPAAWHATIELHRIDSGQWMNAHVYAETQTVRIDGKSVVGIATGELSEPDGKDIPANPELFDEQSFSSTKGKWLKTTYEDIILSEEELN